MSDLADAINRLANAAEQLVVILTEAQAPPPEPPRLADDACPACAGQGSVDGLQCRTCIGRGRIRVS